MASIMAHLQEDAADSVKSADLLQTIQQKRYAYYNKSSAISSSARAAANWMRRHRSQFCKILRSFSPSFVPLRKPSTDCRRSFSRLAQTVRHNDGGPA
jgi:hypothetical protein